MTVITRPITSGSAGALLLVHVTRQPIENYYHFLSFEFSLILLSALALSTIFTLSLVHIINSHYNLAVYCLQSGLSKCHRVIKGFAKYRAEK